ncbi:endonuclease VII domain-containing protein [Paractinoplanes rhizophilus]|uniref:Endonuclease VII domain-containing protein n=1 Tax=Paractinoplanes rhizophilus TaxID=1416877 RepID=A0ABW2HR81_9ACTN
MPATPTKVCPRCREYRDAALFVGASGKERKSCRPCLDRAAEANRRRRRLIGAAGVRAANLREKYGISVEEYDALRERQGYRCAICRRHEDELPATAAGRPRRDGLPSAVAVKLVVDHCHRTRRVRGLLCVGCNAAIGHFRDDEETLRSAIAYLYPTDRDTT